MIGDVGTPKNRDGIRIDDLRGPEIADLPDEHIRDIRAFRGLCRGSQQRVHDAGLQFPPTRIFRSAVNASAFMDTR